MRRDEFALDAGTLKNLGVQVTRFRKRIREKALELHQSDAEELEISIHDVTALANRMLRGYFKGQIQQKNMYFRDFVDETAPGSRKRGRKRKPLTADDKMEIVYKALCKKELRKDVAKEMRVSPQVVSRLVGKFKSERYMEEILQKEQHVDMKVKVVKAMVAKMLEESKFIDSARSVKERIERDVGVDISFNFVRDVMTEKLGMSYRKILKASFHANSPQNVILRQRWGLKFIELWEAGYVFLNIDETWLGMSDYRRMKWREHGTTNSVPTVLLSPRISMIVGVDSLGNSYVTLTQCNSNSSVM